MLEVLGGKAREARATLANNRAAPAYTRGDYAGSERLLRATIAEL